MSTLATVVVAAVIAAFVGALTGALTARRSLRHRAKSAGLRQVSARLPVPRRPPVLGDPGLAIDRSRVPKPQTSLLARARGWLRRWSRAASGGRAGVRARSLFGRRWRRTAGSASQAPGQSPVPRIPGPAMRPPMAPTVVRRAAPAAGWPADPPRTVGELAAAAAAARASLPRTPVLGPAPRAPESGRPMLRVTTATSDATRELPATEGLSIGPEYADVVVRELNVELLLGRSGDLWTIQRTGSADPSVTLDGVPLTSVAMPWTSNRRLTAGAVSLTLENARAADPAFAEPATDISPDLTGMCAARASAYGLAIAMSDGQDAATLATAALAAFDPRMMDPARGAALAALNVTLAVRDARRGYLDSISKDPPRVAVLGVDIRGELRAAANFDVSVWAVTQTETLLLSISPDEAVTTLEVIPLPVRAAGLGERPVLLLTAGAAVSTLRQYLAGATTLRAGPEQLTRAVVGIPDVYSIAAAAVLCSAQEDRAASSG
jgi:hypothetical protein